MFIPKPVNGFLHSSLSYRYKFKSPRWSCQEGVAILPALWGLSLQLRKKPDNKSGFRTGN